MVNILIWIFILAGFLVITVWLLYIIISDRNHLELIGYFMVLVIAYFIQNRRISKLRPALDYDMENRIIEKSAYKTIKLSSIIGIFIGISLLIIDMIINSNNNFSILYVMGLTILGFTIVIQVIFILVQWKPLVESEKE